LVRLDQPLAASVASFPWVLDGVTVGEAKSLDHLAYIASRDVSLAKTAVSFPWAGDGITDAEQKAMQNFAALASRSLPLARTAIRFPWVADGIAEGEWSALSRLASLAASDLPMANRLANMPFLTTSFEPHDGWALYYLADLRTRFPDEHTLLVKQGWFLDGLSDDEAALVNVLGYQVRISLDEFRKLAVAHFAESKIISAPLAGDIQLTVFALNPEARDSATVTQVEQAVLALESFMDVTFPQKEVILLFASPGRFTGYSVTGDELWGLYTGTHLIVNPRLGQGKTTSDTGHIIVHELARYYFWEGAKNLWPTGGGAGFMASYVFDRLYGKSLEERKRDLTASTGGVSYCSKIGITRVQKLVDMVAEVGLVAHLQTPYYICNYILGEWLLLNLYDTMGPDPFRAAWKEVYQLMLSKEASLTEEEIYTVFLRHTPASKASAVKGVYARWHGGEFVH
jgi:hypothetical protein